MITEQGGEFAVYLEQYALSSPWRAVKEESGMNNTTRMVYSGDRKYVLRIYDNHKDAAIVGIEHALLGALRALELPFQIPQPLSNSNGATVTFAPDGKLAALYRYISGNRPSVEQDAHVQGMGAAAAQLTSAFAAIGLDATIQPLYLPYYEFQQTHAAVHAETIAELLTNYEFPHEKRNQVQRLLAAREELTALTNRFKQLPSQWIHGDIVFTNAVADGDRIVGLLDFEFCTVDARAMELAVLLAEFPGSDNAKALHRTELFCKGYGSVLRLTEAEVELLPHLMKLRMMDVWLHFAGRLAEGLDTMQVWSDQIDRVSFVFDWIDSNEQQLLSVFRLLLLEQ